MKILNFNFKPVLLKFYKITLIIIISILSIFLVFFIRKEIKESFRYRIAYYMQLEYEQEYWNCRGDVIEEIKKFIDKNAPGNKLSPYVLLTECDRYNVDIRFVLAQGLLESHYGTKGLAKKTNSVFNMGAFDGHGFDKIIGKYKYPDPNASISPYLKTLVKRYIVDGKTEWDLLNNFVDINGKRYASYKNYESELKSTIGRINVETKLDSLLTQYSYLKDELQR